MVVCGDCEVVVELVCSVLVVCNIVDEFKQLMDLCQLIELCIIYNGNYGVSLLFNVNILIYYVVLFQEKNFWWVIKIDVVDNVECVYCIFVQQFEQLVQVYIDIICFEVGKCYIECLVVYNEECLCILQQEMEQQQVQLVQVSVVLQQVQ